MYPDHMNVYMYPWCAMASNSDCYLLTETAKGKLVLDTLKFDVEVYFASEIDEDALLVSSIRHDTTIQQLGDIRELSFSKVPGRFYYRFVYREIL